jgi:hypothetical protein
MNLMRIERDDLLGDVRFWALLYEHWVKPRAGDSFDDGEQYFFSVRESAVQAFFDELQGAPTAAGSYPEYSVLLTLRHRWRIGVVLSMFPEDFEVQDVVGPPSSDELIVFGVNGGHFRLPALRWEELLLLRDAVRPPQPAIKAKAILLLFPSVGQSSDLDMDAVRRVLQSAWRKSGIPLRHADELVARPVEDFVESRRVQPEMKEALWRNHPKHGWINDSPYSLRNPKADGARRVLLVMRQLFSTLQSGADGRRTSG